VATRTIVTSQPDVACDVCGRRLLRGEQPDVFLGAGQRRIVCELCAPRATHEGWLRETDRHAVSLPSLRARRGRNLFERLRQVGKPAEPAEDDAVADGSRQAEPPPYEFPDGLATAAEESLGAPLGDGAQHLVAGPVGRDAPAERAIAAFNAGEHPRRVAGVARSLGVPSVSVRPDADIDRLVSIVVAWELCWYRYRVDLDDELAGVTVHTQGTELDELQREEREANAGADELGALFLSGNQ
jgi:hypothetical protein